MEAPQPGGLLGVNDPEYQKQLEEYQKYISELVNSGGWTQDSNSIRRRGAWNEGQAMGEQIFVNDPEMQALKAKRQALSDGYDGSELSAIRESARSETAGQRTQDQQRLSSNLAKGGVGGARAAAVKSANDQKYAAVNADNERKIALDSANMKRQGTNDLQDFIFRQKYGVVGTAAGNSQLSTADYAAEQARKANSGGDKGMCFITTAACEHFGLADDCDELQTLRSFRDKVMLKSDNWKDDVKAYYELARELTPKLSTIRDQEFWNKVFSYIKTSVAHIKNNAHQEAYDTYKSLIEFVKGA